MPAFGYTPRVVDHARLIIHTDGASKGNPGPASIGIVIAAPQAGADPQPLEEIAEYLGETTNNVAEYTAVIRALERARELGARVVELRTDSELLTKQLSGEYRVKHPGLRPLYEAVQRLRAGFDACRVVHVRREYNAEADRLANEAIKNVRRRNT